MRHKDPFESELDLLPRTGLDMNRIMFVSLERPDFTKIFNPTEVPYPQDEKSIVIRTVNVPIVYLTVDLKSKGVRRYDSDLNEWNVILFSGWLKIVSRSPSKKFVKKIIVVLVMLVMDTMTG